MNLRQKMTRAALAAGLALTALTGCTTYEQYAPNFTHQQPAFATLLTEGVTIREAGGEWELSRGDSIRPQRIASTARTPRGAGTGRFNFSDYTFIQQLPHYDVRVEVDGRREPLYGKLAFFSVPSTSEPTTLRAWRIELPRNIIDQATGGAVAYVNGEFSYRGNHPSNRRYDAGGDRYYYPVTQRRASNWILWLSDFPLS